MKRKKKVLFISNYEADTAPGQRFRFEQYFDFLNANGYDCRLSPILTAPQTRMLHSKGHYLSKAVVLLAGFFNRLGDVMRASSYDLIFICREAYIAGPAIFEWLIQRSGVPVIYDFDDAIWIENVSEANYLFRHLKYPQKIPAIINKANLVFAGNRFLYEYAKQFNPSAMVVPTTIDTQLYHVKKDKKTDEPVCIGWSGSVTTIQHFTLAVPVFKLLHEKYGNRIRFRVIGDASYKNEDLGIKGIAWSKETETRDLSEIDIGIMPLPNDTWSKGKCGLKGLQYMALGIPTVMSPVGVNTEIVQDGANGFLATTTEIWVEKISQLIESPELRRTIGEAGRETVVRFYSCLSQQSVYLAAFNRLSGIQTNP